MSPKSAAVPSPSRAESPGRLARPLGAAFGARTDRWETAAEVLGGKAVLGRIVQSQMEAHDLLQQGLPAKALHRFVDGLTDIDRARLVDKAIGMSLRTLQRSREAPQHRLSAEQSNRLWQSAEVVAGAMRVFGDRERVQQWLLTPALGLDDQVPLDLMTTSAGAEIVRGFLTRLEYGVYT